VLAFGQLTVGVTCPADTFSCTFEAGLYLDGNPVPDSGFSTTVIKGATRELHTLDLFGLAQDVPAGTHEITVGWKGTSENVAVVATQDDERSGALFVGG